VERLAKSSEAGPSQPKTKKRKLDEQFYHIIPNVTSENLKISVDTLGCVDVYFIMRVDKIESRSITKVPMTEFLYKRLVFSLPENLVSKSNLKNLNAYFAEGNLEIFLNTEKKLTNGKLIPIIITRP
jgi:hypothetical protein